MLVGQQPFNLVGQTLPALHEQDGVAPAGQFDGVMANTGYDGLGHAERVEPLGDEVVLQVVVDEDDALPL